MHSLSTNQPTVLKHSYFHFSLFTLKENFFSKYEEVFKFLLLNRIKKSFKRIQKVQSDVRLALENTWSNLFLGLKGLEERHK